MPLVLTRIVDVVELELFLSLAVGGGDGILSAYGDEFAVTAQAPLSLQVDLGTGAGYISHRRIHQHAVVASASIGVPSGGNDRIDLVQFTLGVGWNIKTGSEDPSPSAPTPDSDSLVPAQIYCRDTMSTIKDTSDGTNGYITLTQVYL